MRNLLAGSIALLFGLLISGCTEPLAIESSSICSPDLKDKYIRVTGKLLYGSGSYRCTGGMASRCSGRFTGFDDRNQMYLEILEGSSPNKMDVRNKPKEEATVFDDNGVFVPPGAPVEITGLMRVYESNSTFTCSCEVSRILKK